MFRKIAAAALLLVLCLSSSAFPAGAGTTGTVFNRRFAHKMKVMMPYDQLARLAGAQGRKVAEDRRSSSALYHWGGGRRSTLDARVAAGRVVEATVTAPKGTRFVLKRNGQMVETD